MRFPSSLRSRIFWALALLAVLSIGAAVYLVSARITREAEEALERELVATGTLAKQLQTSRADTFQLMARLIADAPRLKAAVDTNDPPTVQKEADDYQNELKSNLLLITNETGHVLATVGTSDAEALVVAHQPAIREASAGREHVSLLPQPDGILQLVTVPIVVGLESPDILGTLSVGFLLDNAMAAQLREATGSEIAFGMNGQILASSLPAGDRARLAPLLSMKGGAHEVSLGSQEYVALPLSLEIAEGIERDQHPMALILQSRTDHLRPLRAIRRALAATAIVAVLLATLLSFAVARTITRPLAAITNAMREVASTGDLTKKIVLHGGRWNDEDARLVATTFNTLTESVARIQNEMAQKERLSSLGRLSTVIAHEVRNPLMIIKAAVHALRQPNPDAASVREAATDIDEEVTRLNRLVNEVLDFARPIDFQFDSADLNALCRESAAAAQATPGTAVVLDLDPSLPPVVTDAERLRIVLVNLIVNARYAVSTRHEPTPALAGTHDDGTLDKSTSDHHGVTVLTRSCDAHVAITIADEGVGIDPAELPHVFDPYFTTRRGGTGLGLPIAKNIVEGLGGSIVVVSALGRGTQIRIELPRQHSHPGPR